MFNENGMIVLYNLFLGFGVGVGYTEVTISTHHKYIYDGPDLDDPKYKITPVPLPRWVRIFLPLVDFLPLQKYSGTSYAHRLFGS